MSAKYEIIIGLKRHNISINHHIGVIKPINYAYHHTTEIPTVKIRILTLHKMKRVTIGTAQLYIYHYIVIYYTHIYIH